MYDPSAPSTLDVVAQLLAPFGPQDGLQAFFARTNLGLAKLIEQNEIMIEHLQEIRFAAGRRR